MKEILRREMITKRNALPQKMVNTKSRQILHRFLDLQLIRNRSVVMIYLDFQKEVKTGALIKHLLASDHHVLIPVTNPDEKTLIPSRLLDPEMDLVRGHFGLMEPKPGCFRPVDPAAIDLIIVPGLVFDMRGYRIGFGAGYYDRFLSSLVTRPRLVSLLYEMQLMPIIPVEPHDIPVQLLITEDQVIDCQQG